jgi:cellulose synthase/poly-beta-1,6-N-acetylglucosamine synthase-like glycosyltransferase
MTFGYFIRYGLELYLFTTLLTIEEIVNIPKLESSSENYKFEIFSSISAFIVLILALSFLLMIPIHYFFIYRKALESKPQNKEERKMLKSNMRSISYLESSENISTEK